MSIRNALKSSMSTVLMAQSQRVQHAGKGEGGRGILTAVTFLFIRMISTVIVPITGPGLWNAALVGACELVSCAGPVVYTKHTEVLLEPHSSC